MAPWLPEYRGRLQIIVLDISANRHLEKSRYFEIAKFNYSLIIRLPSSFSYLNFSLTTQGSDLPFFLHKSVVTITYEQNIICGKTHLHGTTYEQTKTLGWRGGRE